MLKPGTGSPFSGGLAAYLCLLGVSLSEVGGSVGGSMGLCLLESQCRLRSILEFWIFTVFSYLGLAFPCGETCGEPYMSAFCSVWHRCWYGPRSGVSLGINNPMSQCHCFVSGVLPVSHSINISNNVIKKRIWGYFTSNINWRLCNPSGIGCHDHHRPCCVSYVRRACQPVRVNEGRGFWKAAMWKWGPLVMLELGSSIDWHGRGNPPQRAPLYTILGWRMAKQRGNSPLKGTAGWCLCTLVTRNLCWDSFLGGARCCP